MLDPWIIEEIRRREDEQRQQDERRPVVVELPYHAPRSDHEQDGAAPAAPADGDKDVPARGVTIIDFTIG
jgi:hypothetical protein